MYRVLDQIKGISKNLLFLLYHYVIIKIYQEMYSAK